MDDSLQVGSQYIFEQANSSKSPFVGERQLQTIV